MPLNYAGLYSLVNDQAFQQRVAMAFANNALAVLAEAEATPNHANRVAFARKLHADPFAYATSVAILTRLLWGSSIAGNNCADSDLDYVIASHLDYFANNGF